MKLNIVKLGKLDYKEALDIQERMHQLRKDDKVDDTLLLVEHPPVLTIGRRGEEANIILAIEKLKSMGVNIYDVNRGGDVTYHGPGQIVGYPIMNLNNYGKNIKQFVGNVEKVFIRLLEKEYGIIAHTGNKEYTGVWVEDEKITAIGFAIKRWVTMHGFAFNVNTNLEHFKWIVPCGITDKGVTSVQKITGQAQNLERLNDLVIKYFCEVFDAQVEIKSLSELSYR